jgi:hypothetical protein
LPLSVVHSIMMEKLAQLGEDGECMPTHFPPIYHQIKGVVYALAERAGTLPLFLLYPYMCSVCPPHSHGRGVGEVGQLVSGEWAGGKLVVFPARISITELYPKTKGVITYMLVASYRDTQRDVKPSDI